MSIEIKRSIKPVDYSYAINLMEKRLEKVINNNATKEYLKELAKSELALIKIKQKTI